MKNVSKNLSIDMFIRGQKYVDGCVVKRIVALVGRGLNSIEPNDDIAYILDIDFQRGRKEESQYEDAYNKI
jgi:hypothetical protein